MSIKKKLDRKNYMFDTRKNEVLIKTPGQIDGKDFVVMNCENCEVYVYDYTSQVFVDDCVDCKIFFGPVEGSLFIRGCKGIQISSAQSQFRVSDSSNIRCCVYSQSDPALENVTDIQFAPYNFSYPLIDTHFKNSKLDVNKDKWSEVFDFTPNLITRNWSLMPPEDYPGQIVKEIEGFPEPSPNPVPISIAYGGTIEKPIVVGSGDSRSQEKGGEVVDFSKIMGKKNVQNIQVNQYQEYDHGKPLQDTDQFVNQQKQSPNIQDIDIDMFLQISNNSKQTSNIDSKKWQNEQDIKKKQEEEKQLKKKKQQDASNWLEAWKRERETQVKATVLKNRQLQDVMLQARSIKENKHRVKGEWQIVTDNIALKQSDYKGSLNVTRMKESILNKNKSVNKQ